MPARLIAPVANNLEKYYTYREYISRYNKAMREGFYFEAMLIDYAMLEDRLRSFLYHMGAFNGRQSNKIDAAAAKALLPVIVNQYAQKNESKNLGITSITGKMKVIRCTLQWACEVTDVPADDRYETVLKSQL